MEFRLLTADDIECRIAQCSQYGVSLLLYKNARVDMAILDETFGVFGWQRHHSRDNANCIVSIWDAEKRQWIEKEDTGTESYTEKEKGLASDSFKRACFNIGIGRELYTAPQMFVFAKDLKTLKEFNGKWTCKDFFKVEEIEYIKRNICYVKILNMKTNQYIEFGTPAKEEKHIQEVAKTLISEAKITALIKRCENEGVKIKTILSLYKVNRFADLTENQYANIHAHWEEIKAKEV